MDSLYDEFLWSFVVRELVDWLLLIFFDLFLDVELYFGRLSLKLVIFKCLLFFNKLLKFFMVLYYLLERSLYFEILFRMLYLL